MNLNELKALFVQTGCTKLYAKPLAPNDNSKNQIYFSVAVETLNVFPSEEIFAENTKKGPSFKARLRFGWLLDNGNIAEAPHAQLILYSQYPEVRFSGFLLGCKAGPNTLMADRQRAKKFSPETSAELKDRVLFLGVTSKQTLGYVVAGNSEIANEFRSQAFPQAFVVFREIPLPIPEEEEESKRRLLNELRRIHLLGWIDSKQLHSNGELGPCQAPQCGGFTLEAELGIPKNSDSDPDFLGWEVKQHSVDNFERLESSKPITMLTPEPDGGFYKDHDFENFIRTFGYVDKKGRANRMNFGGRHVVGAVCESTGLTMKLIGFDLSTKQITDANGRIALLSDSEVEAASWSFKKLFHHWSNKHTRAVYVPSQRRIEPTWQYCYGHKIRLAQGTDSLRLMRAFADGAMYYDPGLKLEQTSPDKYKPKKRNQFRVASKSVGILYKQIETITL